MPKFKNSKEKLSNFQTMMKRIGDIFRQYYFLMPSKFNLKKGLQDQPANVIQLQKGPKIGDLTNLIQKNCISTQKKVEEGSISPQNHSRFFFIVE